MDKTRISDICRFLQSKGYEILQNYGQTLDGEHIMFEVSNDANKGRVICRVTTTEFVVQTDMQPNVGELDFSDEWLDFMLKEHPELKPQMIKELDERINEFTKELDKRKDKISNTAESSDEIEAGK